MKNPIEEDCVHVRAPPQVTRRPLHDEHRSALPLDAVLNGELAPLECKHRIGELPHDCAENRTVEPEPTAPRERNRQHPLQRRDKPASRKE